MEVLTETWFNPYRECWELQRTGGVELTFRNTVISTPTWLSLQKFTHIEDYIKWQDPALKSIVISYLYSKSQNRKVSPVLIPIVGTWTFISFVCLWGISWEGGLLLLYNLSEVEHGMKPVVHHLNGCEKDSHHSRVYTCYHQAGRKGLREREQAMPITEIGLWDCGHDAS